jgi:hypothetical protein
MLYGNGILKITNLRAKWEMRQEGYDNQYKLSILMAVTNEPLCQNM